MRHTLDLENETLCNSCEVREEIRNPKGKKKMATIDILIKCPAETYAEIEEMCMNQGTNATKYFLGLHASNSPQLKEEVIFDNRTLREKHDQIEAEAQKDKPNFNKSKKK